MSSDSNGRRFECSCFTERCCATQAHSQTRPAKLLFPLPALQKLLIPVFAQKYTKETFRTTSKPVTKHNSGKVKTWQHTDRKGSRQFSITNTHRASKRSLTKKTTMERRCHLYNTASKCNSCICSANPKI